MILPCFAQKKTQLHSLKCCKGWFSRLPRRVSSGYRNQYDESGLIFNVFIKLMYLNGDKKANALKEVLSYKLKTVGK